MHRKIKKKTNTQRKCAASGSLVSLDPRHKLKYYTQKVKYVQVLPMLCPSEQSALPASSATFSGGQVLEGSSHTSVGAVVDDKLATLL